MANILPVDKTVIQTITKFTLDISILELNISATFRASLYDINNKYIDAVNVKLEGADYTNWGNDDNYVINFVAQQLGFIIVPEVPEVPETNI